MAEPDSLLQLGIEAARDGNKEEARNLFRLLTRQDSANAQAWLWLAGVAENREERQAALEHVVTLDPTNEMAVKSLQALGARPGGRAAAPLPVEVPTPPLPQPPPPAPPAPSAYDDPFGDDDDPFAELNNLSGVMADAEAPVRRDPPPVATPSTNTGGGSSSPSRGTRPSSSTDGSASRGTRPSSSRRSSVYDENEGTVPARRGMSPLLLVLLGLVGIMLIGLLITSFLNGKKPPVATEPASQQTVAAVNSAATGSSTTSEPTTVLGGDLGTTQPVTATGALDQPTTEPTVAPPTAAPVADVTHANPVIVPANSPLQSEGWLYDFNQPTYAAPIIGSVGDYQPTNGRFAVVLIFAVNNTGTSQKIPATFFVLKDAQGRVWEARPEVSDAYVIPGVNADMSQAQPIPPDGTTRSVALVFDVAPDATNLVFFARSNPTQGWLVLANV
ncbi:MAG: hypothetical protein WCF99_12255 [Chloroflexales bacterium]